MTDTDSESKADAHTTDGNARGMGEEASLGASGSSRAEWSGVERSGTEWSGAERGGADRGRTPLTQLGGDLRRVQM